MDELTAWKNLTSSDHRTAERGIAWLQHRFTASLKLFIKSELRSGQSGAAVESDEDDDIVSAAFTKLWRARQRIAITNERAARALLYRITRQCLLDNIRTRSRTPRNLVDIDAEEAPDSAATDTQYRVLNEILAASLLAAADSVFLGLDRSLLPSTHRRQLLAAQYFYNSRLDCRTIAAMMAPSAPDAEPLLTEKLISAWVHHPGVIRLLAFTELYYDSAHLLGALFNGKTLNDEMIGQLFHQASRSRPEDMAFNDITWSMVAIAILRYYFCESSSNMQAGRHDLLRSWGFTAETTNAILHAIEAQLPFRQDARELLESLRVAHVEQPEKILGMPAVWERLAFQYSYLMQLAQKDILERVQPPAQVAGYTLTDSTLNAWISGERLKQKLIRYWKEIDGDGIHE